MENPTFPVANFTELLQDALCLVDSAGKFVFVSAACERIFGYTPAEMVGRPMIDMVLPEDRARTEQTARAIMQGHPRNNFENRYLRKDGQIVYVRWSASWSEADQLRVAVAHDITERKQAEQVQAALFAISEAAHTAADLPALFSGIHEAIAALLEAPALAVALLDPGSRQLRFVYHAGTGGPVDTDPVAPHQCRAVLAGGTPLKLAACGWTGVPLSTPQGSIGVLMLHTGAGLPDQDLLSFIATQVATAIQRTQLHTQLRYMAQHDDLTGIPNRRLFHDRLDTALARCQRQQRRLALLFIDLNKFKQVNDQFGHHAGDLLLKEVAARIRACVRETDTVARLGGDEFVVLLEELVTHEQAALVRDKIHHALAAPIVLPSGISLIVGVSIGVALYPEHGGDAQRLLRHADQTMYAAKR